MKNAYVTKEKIALLEREMQQVVTDLRTHSKMNHTQANYKSQCAEALSRARQLTTHLMQWQVLLACEAQDPDLS